MNEVLHVPVNLWSHLLLINLPKSPLLLHLPLLLSLHFLELDLLIIKFSDDLAKSFTIILTQLAFSIHLNLFEIPFSHVVSYWPLAINFINRLCEDVVETIV